MKKLLAVVCLLVILLPLGVEAQAPSGDMTSSMVSFFRQERTRLNTNTVSRDEMFVYAVFLSNFLRPGITTIGDLTSDALVGSVSTRFFGQPKNVEDLRDIHNRISEEIERSISGEGLAALKTDSSLRNHLTGTQLLTMLASGGEKRAYTRRQGTGDGLIDFGDPIMSAVMQVLFAYSPELFLHEKYGLRGFGRLYMDGVGNIWGGIDNMTVDNYVLILPAALNPYVFRRGSEGLKFPVVNSFVMGAIPNIQRGILDRENTPLALAYYGVKGFFRQDGRSNRDANNMLSIFGVTTPIARVGNSDALLEDTTFNRNEVTAFINQTIGISPNNTGIVLAMDPSKEPNLNALINGLGGFDLNQRLNLIRYFVAGRVIPLDRLQDTMYYLNFQGSGGPSWTGPMDAFVSQRLFTNKDGTELFQNSYDASPFVRFLLEYDAVSADGKQAFLREKTGVANLDTTNLINFLDDGIGVSGGIRRDVSHFFVGGGGFLTNLPQGSNISYLIRWWVLRDREADLGFALTNQDSAVIKMLEEQPGAFMSALSLGSIALDSNITPAQQHTLANIFFNFNTYRVFGLNSSLSTAITGFGLEKISSDSGRELNIRNYVANDVNNWAGIYWSYIVDLLDIDAAGGRLSGAINNATLVEFRPRTLNTGGLDLNARTEEGRTTGRDAITEAEMKRNLVRQAYGLLSDEANPYRDRLIKATQDSWVLSTHRAIIGSWVGNALAVETGAVTPHAAIVGYINTPTLRELPFVSWVLDNFMQVYVFLMLFVFVMMVFMVITNLRTPREAILAVLIMSVVLVMPQVLLNNSIAISNRINDAIFSDRFNFWAITQHQQTFSRLADSMVTGNTLDPVIARNMEVSRSMFSSDTGVRLKWMSPKKHDAFNIIFSDTATGTDLALFRWLFSSFILQEEFTGNPLDTFVYRPYNSIAQAAFDSFEKLSRRDIGIEGIAEDIVERAKTTPGVVDSRFALFPKDKEFINVSFSEEQLHLIESVKLDTPIRANIQPRVYRYWHAGSDLVNSAIFNSNFLSSDAGLRLSGNPDMYTEAFLLLTESPFYYFYNALKHNYGGSDDFRQSLFNPEKYHVRVDYTQNGVVNRTLNKQRDFLDMEGLFRNVIPLLRQSNDFVRGWTAVNGSEVPRFNFSGGVSGNESEEFLEAKRRREGMAAVWKMYSPWVSSLEDLGVNNQRARVAGRSIRITDALCPGSYDSVGRPMIWSEADMYAKNYREGDLTDIEHRIQRVLYTTHLDMLYLVNYSDFDNEVLITAAAMIATFNFNREFSDTRFWGNSVVMYPQSFELRNFNYDAFLRMILLNATGSPLMVEEDLYVRVIEQSSIFTGIFLLLKSVIAVIVIPAIKIIILLSLLILGFLVCLSCVLNPPDKILQVVFKSVVIPILIFSGLNVAFAFVVSMFVGEGRTALVGSRVASISLNDPTTTLVVLIIVSLAYVVAMYRVLEVVIAGVKAYGGAVVFSSAGTVVGVGGMLVSRITRGVSDVVGSGGNISNTESSGGSEGSKSDNGSNGSGRSNPKSEDLLEIDENTNLEDSRVEKKKGLGDFSNTNEDTENSSTEVNKLAEFFKEDTVQVEREVNQDKETV